MGWSGSLTANSAVGSAITFTPDNPESSNLSTTVVDNHKYAGNYSVSSFTAPKKGVYQFILRGAGGAQKLFTGQYGGQPGGTGGYTVGYLLLEQNETVYVGAGGCCRASFISKAYGSNLAAISASNLRFVAGAAGSGGGFTDKYNGTGYNCKLSPGGNGGGSSGAKPSTGDAVAQSGNPGTQSGGGASAGSGSVAGSYGTGGNGNQYTAGNYGCHGGRGGDGYYGGSGGTGSRSDNGCISGGGAGGSGYIYTSSIKVGSKTYTNSTSQGGGAGNNAAGSVVVTYYARAELPVIFNGTTLERLIFNGVEVESLIYDGTRLFMRRLRNAAQNCIAAWRHGAHFLRNQRAYA